MPDRSRPWELRTLRYVRFVGDTDDDDGFNLIEPSLIQKLKSVLSQYPDDGQILKVFKWTHWN